MNPRKKETCKAPDVQRRSITCNCETQVLQRFPNPKQEDGRDMRKSPVDWEDRK